MNVILSLASAKYRRKVKEKYCEFDTSICPENFRDYSV